MMTSFANRPVILCAGPTAKIGAQARRQGADDDRCSTVRDVAGITGIELFVRGVLLLGPIRHALGDVFLEAVARRFIPRPSRQCVGKMLRNCLPRTRRARLARARRLIEPGLRRVQHSRPAPSDRRVRPIDCHRSIVHRLDREVHRLGRGFVRNVGDGWMFEPPHPRVFRRPAVGFGDFGE